MADRRNQNDRSKKSLDDDQLDMLIYQIEFLKILTRADDKDDFIARINSVIANFGFSGFSFFTISDACVDAPFFTTPELINAYKLESYFKHDLVIASILAKNYKPVFLSTLKHFLYDPPVMTHIIERNLEIYRLYGRYGIQDAYFFPIAPDEENKQCPALFVIMNTVEGDELFPARINRYQPILELLAKAIHVIGYSKFYSGLSSGTITPKALQLLTFMAKNNVSLTQGADALGISIDKANKLMGKAKKELATESQANAVYLAIKRGFIDLDSD